MAKQVLITGATSGIGREAALQMARQGASLILPARDLAGIRRHRPVQGHEGSTTPIHDRDGKAVRP